MSGPPPITDHDFIVDIYDMMGVLQEAQTRTQEQTEKRLCALEEAQQEELIWRNRIIGGGVAATALLSMGITLVKLWR